MATSSVSAAAPASAAAVAPPQPSRWRRWVGELYPAVVARPLNRRTVLWAGLGLVVATAVNLLRTGGHGALNTIWIEDAITFLNDGYNKRFTDVIFHPESGYFQLMPKIYAEIASVVPIRFGAPVLAMEAAVTWAAVAVIAFMASRPFLPQWWLRVLVAAPVVLVPVGHTQADNDVATLHFPALYAVFWVLMWQPATRLGRIVAVVVTAVAATSSFLVIAFIPLALLRLVSLRGWGGRLVPSVYLAGMALQLYGLASGLSVRVYGDSNYNPFWALKEYVVTSLPRSIFGERWLGGPKVDVAGVPTDTYGVLTTAHVILIVASLLLLAAVVACGLLGVTRPHWPLATVATVFSIALFCEGIISMGTVQPRYVIAPALLLYVAIVAILRPEPAEALTASERPSRIPEQRAAGPGESVPDDAAPPGVASPDVVSPGLASPGLASPDAAELASGRTRWTGTPVRLRSAAPVLAFVVLLAVVSAVNYRVTNARATSASWSATAEQAAVYCGQEARHARFFFYGYHWWHIEIPCYRLR